MRGLDPTNGRVRIAAWAARLVLLASATARAQDPADSYAAPRPADPVGLHAERVRTWEAGGQRWAILETDAAVLQGETDGLRARRCVVRYGPDPDDPATERVEVFADGGVTLIGEATVRPTHRMTFRTTGGVRPSPYRPAGLARLTRPPADAAALLRVAFPASAPIVAAAPSLVPAAAGATARLAGPPPPRVMEPLVTLGVPVVEDQATARPAAAAPKDAGLVRTQVTGDPFDAVGDMNAPSLEPPAGPSAAPAPAPAAGPPESEVPSPPDGATATAPAAPRGVGEPAAEVLPPLDAFPGVDLVPGEAPQPNPLDSLITKGPVQPGSQRSTTILPRNGGTLSPKFLPTTEDGTNTIIVTGGVNVIINSPPPRGTVDISADNVVIWYRNSKKRAGTPGPGQALVQDEDQMMEVYMEGNVVVRQDERTVAGNGDQRMYQATQAFYDVRMKRLVALDAELDLFVPGLVSPLRVMSPRIQQFSNLVPGPRGKLVPAGPTLTRADRTVTTGSRFADPGYRFRSRGVDITETVIDLTDPNSGALAKPGPDGQRPKDKRTLVEARQNVFFIGAVPVFYWPKIVFDPDDPTPPIQNLRYQYGNYFGNQLLTDWNGFKLFGIKKPKPSASFNIDAWNVDIDYLSRRGPAFGSEIGFFGESLIPGYTGPHFGYFDFWGIRDKGFDVLGGGPALVTDSQNPAAGIIPGAPFGPSRAKYSRSAVPSFTPLRGKLTFREMTSLLTPDAAPDEDFRAQLEFGYLSDRHFLEEYYKRLFDTGLDQETLAYVIRQRQNHAFTVLTEANLQNFYTDTQWLPKLDYYRLGDSLLADRLTYYTNSGVDYANTHTAIEVGNANVFAFLPTDPVSNTGRQGLQTGRAWTTHELDLPISLGFLKFTPYVQGQAVGWNNQLGGGTLGRVWGAAGGRASVIAWKKYDGWFTDSELLNIHGLNHKVQFDVDARFAYSNVNLDRIGIQDDLDDNTYEYVRRYFAMTNFANAVLPPQYDPRHLILRRAISPITGTTDVQASMDTIQLGIHQRLQTRRGPEGRRRIIDYMVLDLTTTYYPYAARDNFNKPFGQNMYNFEWYIGDRTSITSYGWFEFFDITGGQAFYNANPTHTNNPFQFAVVTAGLSMSRPPRANLYMGYSIIDTGPINTSALTTNYSYLLSPKWYSSFSTMYDFGNHILLSATFSVTKVGADFLTSLGLTVDPQRQNITAGFQITPRISPNIRLGSSGGIQQFDTRFSPTQ